MIHLKRDTDEMVPTFTLISASEQSWNWNRRQKQVAETDQNLQGRESERKKPGRLESQERRLLVSLWDGATSPWLRARLYMSRVRLPPVYHIVASSGLRWQEIPEVKQCRGHLRSPSNSHYFYACIISIFVYANTLDYYPKQTHNANFLTI